MRCHLCKRDIHAGSEQAKMVLEYEQTDGTVKSFLSGESATGRIVRGWHGKCIHQVKHREGRGGDAAGGKSSQGATVYDIEEITDTRFLSEQAEQIRGLASLWGMAVDDWAFKEKYRAYCQGGVYDHSHQTRPPFYQLPAHMQYAHGFVVAEADSFEGLSDLHAQEHSKVSDYHDHTVVNVNDL